MGFMALIHSLCTQSITVRCIRYKHCVFAGSVNGLNNREEQNNKQQKQQHKKANSNSNTAKCSEKTICFEQSRACTAQCTAPSIHTLTHAQIYITHSFELNHLYAHNDSTPAQIHRNVQSFSAHFYVLYTVLFLLLMLYACFFVWS